MAVEKQARIDLKVTGVAEGEARAKAIAKAFDDAEKSAGRLGARRVVAPQIPAPAVPGATGGGGGAAAAALSTGAGAEGVAAGLGSIAAPAAAAAAAIYATAAAGEALFASLGRGEKAQGVADSFAALSKSVGGASATLAALRGATGGVVTDQQLMLSTNKLLVADLGLSQEQLTKLAGAAVSLSRVMGTDATTAVEDLSTGILRQSPAILDNLGIFVRSEEALKAYADAHGTTTEKLDAQTKKQIFLTETMKALDAAQQKAGATGTSVANIAQQLSTKWANFSTEIDKLVAKQPGFAASLASTADAALRIATALTPLIELAGKAAAALAPVIDLGGKAVALVAGNPGALSAAGSALGPAGLPLALLGAGQAAAQATGAKGLTGGPAVVELGPATTAALAPKPGASPFLNGYGGT